MSSKKVNGFSSEERAAVKERAKELKAEQTRVDGESEVLAKIAEMQEPDRSLAERIHMIIKASAPALVPKTWYGSLRMPTKTTRSSASSNARRSSTIGTRRSASTTVQSSTKAACGPLPMR